MIMKCSKCNSYILTECGCGGKAVQACPARFSIHDKYGKYRRIAKKLYSSQKK